MHKQSDNYGESGRGLCDELEPERISFDMGNEVPHDQSG